VEIYLEEPWLRDIGWDRVESAGGDYDCAAGVCVRRCWCQCFAGQVKDSECNCRNNDDSRVLGLEARKGSMGAMELILLKMIACGFFSVQPEVTLNDEGCEMNADLTGRSQIRPTSRKSTLCLG
jgi:hypothetical protein